MRKPLSRMGEGARVRVLMSDQPPLSFRGAAGEPGTHDWMRQRDWVVLAVEAGRGFQALGCAEPRNDSGGG
jgi:hypothetical protein